MAAEQGDEQKKKLQSLAVRQVRLQCLVRWSERLLALQTNHGHGYLALIWLSLKWVPKGPLVSPLHNRLQLVSSVSDTLPLQMICVSSQCDSLCL